jgi:glycosyltransferase involved in cell wall biosynthesis
MNLYYSIFDKKFKIIHFLNYNQIYYFLKNAPKDKYIITAGIWNSVESIVPLIRIYITFILLTIRFKTVTFAILCNTRKELHYLRFLKLLNIRTVFCNHNCFLDPEIFKIHQTEKKFKALYIAKLESWKRHKLAKLVENIAFITYNVKNVKYRNYLLKIMPDSIWLNFNSYGKYKFLNSEETMLAINAASCTLALSKREGAMYASGESLLCGIPVISIPSKGGRDVFFNDMNSIIVKPNPNEINIAVEKITDSNQFDSVEALPFW